MFEGLSQESADVLKSVVPQPTLEQVQAALQPAIQSLQEKLASARQNVAELEADEQRHINASNELSARMNAQG